MFRLANILGFILAMPISIFLGCDFHTTVLPITAGAIVGVVTVSLTDIIPN